ncbi:MAG TPA: sulfur carrier protein ThiS [Solirubrobacteraceae bacterium]|nr:sulfur carrier protein ThiS [Solirubrobacteraceae bacterium]
MIHVNGDPVDGHDGATVAELLGTLDVPADRRGIAVALDGDVLPRSEWPTITVAAGARVEVLTAMQGG